MMKYLPLFGMTLLSCSTTVEVGEALPIYDNQSRQVCFDPCPAVEDVAVAISLTDSLLMSWGLDHTQAFENLDIIWNSYNGGDYLGLTHSTHSIEIWDRTPGDVTGSAFAHELIHVALWEQFDDPDADHTNILFDQRDGNPSIERMANAEIRKYGL